MKRNKRAYIHEVRFKCLDFDSPSPLVSVRPELNAPLFQGVLNKDNHPPPKKVNRRREKQETAQQCLIAQRIR